MSTNGIKKRNKNGTKWKTKGINNGPGINEARKKKRDDAKNEKKQLKALKIQILSQETQENVNPSSQATLNSKIEFENELTNLVNYLFSLTKDLNVEGRIQATHYAIDKYKEKLIENFDLFMVAANAFLKDSIDYNKLNELNNKIYKESVQNPDLFSLNKKKLESSEPLILEGFYKTNFWHLLLTKLLPELRKIRDDKTVESHEKCLIKNILRDLPATYCLIELFIRNALSFDYYLGNALLREKCDQILEIGASAQDNLLLELDIKIQSALDTQEIPPEMLSDSHELLLSYRCSIMYLSCFQEDYSKLLNQALLFSQQLDKRGEKISKLTSPVPLLTEIKAYKEEFQSWAEELKADQEEIKFPSILLFNNINAFYTHVWDSDTLPQELDLERFKCFKENVDKLILLISKKNSDEIKFMKPIINLDIVSLLSEYNSMPLGSERYQAGIKVSQLLKEVIPYSDFSTTPNEKCVVLTTQAIFKRMEKDIQEVQLKLIMLGEQDQSLNQNTHSSKQPQENPIEELITDFSSLKINESANVDEIFKNFSQIAESTHQLFKRKIELDHNEFINEEKKLIQQNKQELNGLLPKLTLYLENYKKRKKEEFEKRKNQIIQNHTQQLKIYENKFNKEKEQYEVECKTLENVLDQNKNELELVAKEYQDRQKASINQIKTYKEQLKIEITNLKRDLALKKSELNKRQKTEIEEKKNFEKAKTDLIDTLKKQNEAEITSLENTHQQALQKLQLEQDDILEKAKKDLIEQNEAEITSTKNTHQQELQKLRQEILEKGKKDLIEQNASEILSLKNTHQQELQKLQLEQDVILKEVEKHIQQLHQNNCAQLLTTQHEEISALKHSIEQARKPYEAIIGLTHCATIPLPGEAKALLQLLEKHNIENYIIGDFLSDALYAVDLIDFDNIDIRVNCSVLDLPSDILACADLDSNPTGDTIKIGRINLFCKPWKNLKEELREKTDFEMNTLICRNGRVYDLLGIYNHLMDPYLITMKPAPGCYIEDPAIILREILFSIKLFKSIPSTDYEAILSSANLIFKLPLGKYTNNLQKLFSNYAAPEYYRRVKNLGLLHIVIPFLPDNYQNYEGFASLERFWLQKMYEFSHCPRKFNGHHVLALFLLMRLLPIMDANLSLMTNDNVELSLKYVGNSLQYVINDLLSRFVGFSTIDQNVIIHSLPALILGSEEVPEVPGLYLQYHYFKEEEYKNQEWVSQNSYSHSNELTHFSSSYTPAYQSLIPAQRNGNFSGQVVQYTTQETLTILKKRLF